ncbi:MAG: UvrD-helicase domain-containing protein [Oligoflexia bacterium]|nr:UvrD-helicase domain-containing protein [Oligoflexia bacterium]
MSRIASWTHNLNPEQCKAALHNEGPLLILAGAGSGKTTVLVTRTGRLIDEKRAAPKEICVLTFTNKSARELKNRVTAKLGDQAQGVWAGTFHSFGLQILRQFHKEAGLPKFFGILDSSDSQSLVKEIMRNFNLSGKIDFDAGKLLSVMGNMRALGKSENPQDDEYSTAAEWCLPKYMKKLSQLGVVDFDNLIQKPLELFDKSKEVKERVQNAFKFVMVDEFQDTNKPQLALVTNVVEKHLNIAVVGDDDQSIYGWRGACIENILTFPSYYEKCAVVRLERNYRSTPAILNLANAVISKNEKRHAKKLKSDPNAQEGILPEVFVYESEEEEVERVIGEITNLKQSGREHHEFAILFRSNSQGALLEAEMRKQGIPHQITGGTAFFDRKEIRDILAYLRSAIRPNEVSFRRILNVPSRGIGEATVDLIAESSSQNKTSFYKAAKEWRNSEINENAGLSIDQLIKDLDSLVPDLVATDSTPGDKLINFLTHIGYKNYLEKESKDSLAFSKRWGLVGIFAQVLNKFAAHSGRTEKTIKGFIDAMELRDNQDEEDKSSVSLMTLHSCKGLEFPIVFMVGIEEDVIPHRTLGSDISEERRLFYVGVTRAQERLILSRARQRKRHGKLIPSAPSRFLLEIPKELYKEYELGWRPLSGDARKSLLEDLYKKLAFDATNETGKL